MNGILAHIEGEQKILGGIYEYVDDLPTDVNETCVEFDVHLQTLMNSR